MRRTILMTIACTGILVLEIIAANAQQNMGEPTPLAPPSRMQNQIAPGAAGETAGQGGRMDDHHEMMSPGMMGGRMMRPGAMNGGMMGGGMMGGGMSGGGMMDRAHGTGPQPMTPLMMRMMFALVDADGNGSISLQEFQSAHERIFKAMDANKDGALTPDEMMSFMHASRMGAPQ